MSCTPPRLMSSQRGVSGRSAGEALPSSISDSSRDRRRLSSIGLLSLLLGWSLPCSCLNDLPRTYVISSAGSSKSEGEAHSGKRGDEGRERGGKAKFRCRMYLGYLHEVYRSCASIFRLSKSGGMQLVSMICQPSTTPFAAVVENEGCSSAASLY